MARKTVSLDELDLLETDERYRLHWKGQAI